MRVRFSKMDRIDQKILELLQADATLPTRAIAAEVGLTTTPCWRRIQNLEKAGIITGRVTLVDPRAVNLGITAIVSIRTNDHSSAWLETFLVALDEFSEIVEAYRASGEIDYVLKVVVPDITAYDGFYKRLIDKVDLYDVRSTFVMEELKRTTELPLHYA